MWTIVLYLLLSSGLLYAAADDGIGIDPHGGARSAAACGDDGNGLDPHGRPCTQRIQADDGNGFDPHG